MDDSPSDAYSEPHADVESHVNPASADVICSAGDSDRHAGTDLYPRFYSDADGNIVAHNNGRSVIIVRAGRRADYHSSGTGTDARAGDGDADAAGDGGGLKR